MLPSAGHTLPSRLAHGQSDISLLSVMYFPPYCAGVTCLSIVISPQLWTYLIHPSPSLDNIWVMVIVWKLRGNIIRTALCWIVWHNVHSLQHTYMSSSYRSNRLGLSHWDPYAVHRGSFLELYYCNMVEWFWWDSSQQDLWQPTGFFQYFNTVGLVIWPVKIVPEMTYYMSSGTLNPTHSLTQGIRFSTVLAKNTSDLSCLLWRNYVFDNCDGYCVWYCVRHCCLNCMAVT